MTLFRKWSKWGSIGVTTYGYDAVDILRRECELTGLVQYKQVKIGTSNILLTIISWYKSKK
jgi:hypothetical protein